MKRRVLGIDFELSFGLNPPVEDLEVWRLLGHEDHDGEQVEQFVSRSYRLELREKQLDENTVLLRWRITHRGGLTFLLKESVFRFSISMRDLARIWHLDPQGMIYPGLPVSPQGGGYEPPGKFSSFAGAGRSIPVLLCLDAEGRNVVTVGLIDQVPMTLLEGSGPFGRKPPTRPFSFTLRRWIEGTEVRLAQHEDGVFVSRAPRSWFESLAAYSAIVDAESGFEPEAEPADQRLYGPCWNSALGLFDEFTQEIASTAAAKAAELGVRVFMLDIGWDTDLPWGVEKIGDGVPNPERFPDFPAFSEKVHSLGMYVTVNWFPFVVGPQAKAYPELESALMVTDAGRRTMELCPRTPAAREHLRTVARRLFDDFGVDGLWIDEIDAVGFELVDFQGWRYQLSGPCVADHEHSYATNAEGIDACLAAVRAEIATLHEAPMLVFRRLHGNIRNKRYATHLWPPDNAFDAIMSRRECVVMRSFGDGCLIQPYCDCWPPDESEQRLASRLMSQVLVGVPTVTFDFEDTPDEHLAVLKTWFDFYRERAPELHAGELRPLVLQSPEYAVAVSCPERAYVGYFQVVPGETELPRPASELYLLNCSSRRLSTTITNQTGRYEVEILDHLLRSQGSTSTTTKGNRLYLDLEMQVPGVIKLTRAD